MSLLHFSFIVSSSSLSAPMTVIGLPSFFHFLQHSVLASSPLASPSFLFSLCFLSFINLFSFCFLLLSPCQFTSFFHHFLASFPSLSACFSPSLSNLLCYFFYPILLSYPLSFICPLLTVYPLLHYTLSLFPLLFCIHLLSCLISFSLLVSSSHLLLVLSPRLLSSLIYFIVVHSLPLIVRR